MSFADAIQLILINEGGYVNDPNDPGGETNFGICKRAYPNVDIKNLTVEQATDIYRKDYWDKCRCDELPSCIQGLVFDTAVNQGTKIAIVLLQRALKIKEDGVIGMQTIATAVAHASPALVRDYTVVRVIRYVGTVNFDRYGAGWIRRAVGVALGIA
jgi:lysozyme family protein